MVKRSPKIQRGFSLVELVLVVAIMLAIAAMALPKFLNFTATYQLRGGLNAVSGVIQQARQNAVRSNATIQVVSSALGSTSIIYGDTNGNSSWDTTERGAQLSKQIKIKTSGYPGDAYANVSTYAVESQTTPIKFNARGLPCVVSGTLCQNLDASSGSSIPVGFVIYVQNTGKYGSTGWGAVTISPAGRVQTWIWNGNAYSKQ